MSPLIYILLFGFAMSLIALVGSFTLLMSESGLQKIILPLVSIAAGTLIGGAFFHLLPEAIAKLGNQFSVFISLAAGFLFFFILEQFLHWHHCHRFFLQHHPVSYLILLADGIHNLIGGLAVGSAFLIDIKLGIIIWAVAAVHEIPQELGDFGILLHSGWSKKKALLFNLISALTFPLGALLAYAASGNFNISLLLPFAAGNFLYIGAADLIPELRSKELSAQIMQFIAFFTGLIMMLALTWI